MQLFVTIYTALVLPRQEKTVIQSRFAKVDYENKVSFLISYQIITFCLTDASDIYSFEEG